MILINWNSAIKIFNSDIHQLFMNSKGKLREDLKKTEWEKAKRFSSNQTDAVQQLSKRSFRNRVRDKFH